MRWLDPPPVPEDLPKLHPHPVIHALLATRLGASADVAEFLSTKWTGIPANLSELPGLDAAVDRIERAVDRGERVAIFGDYDADGITSTAIMANALAALLLSERLAIDLPSRDEGYGLNVNAVEAFAGAGANLLIAVDCGSNGIEAAARARELGLDLLAIDHHELTEPFTHDRLLVSARLNPAAPFRELPAAALTLLVVTALARRGRDVGAGTGVDPEHLLDLAMIGIIADVADVRGVNRSLVREGIRRIRQQPRPGIKALLDTLKIPAAAVDSRVISHRISPALNAPGRAGDPAIALELLMATDPDRAGELAEEVLAALAWVRAERARLSEQAMAQIDGDLSRAERRLLLVALENASAGVAGAVAGGIVNDLGTPAIVLTRNGDVYQGSARSPEGFDIGGALQQVRELLVRCGGHKRAAGLTVEVSRLEELREALEAIAAEAGLEPGGEPMIQIDAELPGEHLTMATWRALAALRPWGEGNREPVFRMTNAPVYDYSAMGENGRHLKIRVQGPDGLTSVIFWSGADRSRELVGARAVDLVGTLSRNEWNGKETVQFIVTDFRPVDSRRD